MNNDFLNSHRTEGFLCCNSNGAVFHITDQARKLLELDDLKSDIIIQDFIFLDSNTLLPIPFEETVKDGANYIIEIPSAKHQKYISATFIQDDNDNLIISLYDNSILIRKLIELKKQEYNQRLLVSSINDIIFEVNKDGIFLNYWTNKPNLLIHPPSSFIGRPLTDILPQEISYKILSLIRSSIREKKQKTFEYTLQYPKDVLRWYSLIVKNIPDQSEIVVLVITDITKQKEYQDKLIFSEQRFYQAFHFSGVGTTLTSLEGYLLEGNKTVSQILGYSKEELQQIRSIDITHSEDKNYDLTVRKELIEGKKNYHTFLKRYLHKDNYYVWCSITMSLVRDTSDQPQYFIVQLVDMTEFIRNNEELKLKKKKLETIKAHLESKIVQNEEANYIIAHNLLSPIANIKMLVDNIKASEENGMKDAFLDLLSSSCKELEETLDDLKDIASKINNSIQNEEKETCNFNDILKNIIELKQPLITKKNARIRSNFQAVDIRTHRLALFTIMEELIDNALQFSEPSRILDIQLDTHYDEDSIILTVKDNGLGMDLNKVKSQLFMFKKIFHRGFNTKGLGLNITKYQVDSLGGKIDVESMLGEGTTFYVKFPNT